MIPITRRSLLGLVPAWLAMPHRYPTPPPLDRATADRLAELHREYRESWTLLLGAHRAFEAERHRAWEMPEGEDRDRAYELLCEKITGKDGPESRHRRALAELHEAIVVASGKSGRPRDNWEDNGRPSAAVRVGDLLYVATSSFDLDMYGDENPGRGDVVVIDLAEL